jgi:hypothetical protein
MLRKAMKKHEDSEDYPDRVARGFNCFLIAAVVIVVASQAVFIGKSWLPYPVNDHLTFIIQYTQLSGVSEIVEYLFVPHNEHLMPITKAILILDFEIFDGSMFILLAVNIISWLLLTTLLVRSSPPVGPWGRAVFSTLTICLFAFSWGLECFFWSFPFQQLLVLPFSILAIHFGIKSIWSRSTRYYFLSLTLAVAAFLTSAQGLLVLPILTLGTLLARRNLHMFWAFGLPSAVVWSVFFLTTSVGNGSALEALAKPVRVIRFLTFYFGVPLTAHPRLMHLGQAVGLLILIVTIAISVRTLGRRGAQSPNGLFWFSTLMFGGGIAVIIALGRLYSIETLAPSSRYWPFVALVIVSLCALLLTTDGQRTTNHNFLRSAGVAAFLIVFIFVHLRVGENWIEWTDSHRAAVGRVVDGTGTSEDWLRLCDDRSVAESALQAMRRTRSFLYRN